jgi:hypothetical protein
VGIEISPGVSAMLWWLLPAIAPVVAWYLISKRSKADPNADISEGIDELRRFQKAVAKPTVRQSPSDDENQAGE